MEETIKTNVIYYISSFTNIEFTSIEDGYILKKHPLMLDNTKLGFLAISLRGYLKSINPEKTVLATELRKNNLTVEGTYKLIIQKVAG